MTTATIRRSGSNTSESKQVLRVRVTSVYDRVELSQSKFVISIGGAGSSKSYSMGQLFVRRLQNMPNRKMLVTRKTGPALTLTAYALIVSLLKQYGIYWRMHHDKSMKIIENPRNGASITFMSIDDPEKIKSTDFNDTWMEEANEFDYNDFIILQTRMRSAKDEGGIPNQIFMTLNPGEEQGWINQKVIESPAFKGRVDTIWSNYRDNPHLGQDYIDTLESLKDQDEDAYNIFTVGKYGQLSHIIYSPYIMLQELPKEYDEVIFGVDFGFNNPSAIVQVGSKDMLNLFLKQVVYQTKLLNSQLIALAKELVPQELWSAPWYGDSAEPDRIKEWQDEGFNMVSSDKEVKAGLDFCKRFKYHTVASNVDLNKERGIYKWRKNAQGQVLDEPVKFMDHAMDAKRYAIYTHYKDQLAEPKVTVVRHG